MREMVIISLMAVRAVLFDFGGVLAEEGFREGLKAIARKNNIDQDAFFVRARELIYSCGYLTGYTDEHTYWKSLRGQTGISGTDVDLRESILTRFVLRHRMFEEVRRLRAGGLTVGILSDQTDWLEMLNDRYDFYRHFDVVFNSFRLHKSKRDATLFDDVASVLKLTPSEIVFVDDDEGHAGRAKSRRFIALQFKSIADFKQKIRRLV